VICESQVFNAVVEWVKYDVNSRQRLLKKLIKNVRCHLLKPEFISKQLENCEIIRSTCYDYLTKVLEDLKAYIPIEIKSRQLDIPQRIYVINCVPVESDEKYLESTQLNLFETEVGFELPKLCLPYRSRCAVINGFIYVLNKGDGGMDRYDPISNQWKKCKSSYIHMNLPEIVSLRSEIYVIEGGGENRLMKYDPIADEWTEIASLNKNCRFFGCTVFNRMLYLVGGCVEIDFHHELSIALSKYLKNKKNGFLLGHVDRYDPINNQWTSVTPMLTRRLVPGV